MINDHWAQQVAEEGYIIEFEPLPPFSGIKETPLRGPSADILTTEVKTLLSKDAIEVVPENQAQEGFYSTFFSVPKKGGGV